MSEAADLDGALLDAMPDAIVVADRSGSLVQVNAQTLTLFGYQRAQLLGQPVELLRPERYRAQHVTRHGAFHAAPRVRALGAGDGPPRRAPGVPGAQEPHGG